ncbi:hypothetical protein RM863_12805 [Streptomyces sp. DSM 41014]|uniref:Head fiber protein n=1 Tax=Streptomyces hintoniae TaxID=3075521 RepID=A0ABU2UIT1_9ACTN|nr:hypothetical protein [Streptomyces sp. DSM 41014]MDT0473004.1 hypothetical protein [Streptomyces sp. DSM 41014]
MAAEKQVTLIKGGTRRDNKGTTTLRVVDPAPALMDGATKPTVNNVSAAPTQADFNALLAALRTRGVIGGS